MSLSNKKASELFGAAMSDHELTEMRKHEIMLQEKNVVTLVFRFERYE